MPADKEKRKRQAAKKREEKAQEQLIADAIASEKSSEKNEHTEHDLSDIDVLNAKNMSSSSLGKGKKGGKGLPALKDRLPLLDEEDDWFSPQFEAVLEELFDRLDMDKDGAWNLLEVQSFAQLCNGVDFNQNELEDMQMNLEHNEDGHFVLRGLKELYHLQTNGHCDETWKDLVKWGYNGQLKFVGVKEEEEKKIVEIEEKKE